MTEITIPDCLKRRLVFGDLEQIAALKKIERQLIEKEEKEEVKKNGEDIEYKVTLIVAGCCEKYIWAKNLDSAREQANKLRVSNFDCDLDLEIEDFEIEEI